MDITEISTDIQLFNFKEGDTILKGLLIISLYLLYFVGFMTLYVKKFINYYYAIFVFNFIIFTLLFDTYNVDKFGFYSISILFSFGYCIYLNYYLSKKDY
jgi:hypothetical protein